MGFKCTVPYRFTGHSGVEINTSEWIDELLITNNGRLLLQILQFCDTQATTQNSVRELFDNIFFGFLDLTL